MSYAARAKASTARLAQHYGGGDEVTIRRPVRLSAPATGDPVTTLAVNGTTAAGAASIDLDAASLVGRLPVGVTFTIAGDGTTYTTSNSVTASSNALTAVTFTPVLASEAADDAAVTLTSSYGSTSFTASQYMPYRDNLEGGAEDTGQRWLLVAVAEETVYPVTDDVAVWQGDTFRVGRVKPHRVGGTVAGLRIELLGDQS